jgi:hypothetical protein
MGESILSATRTGIPTIAAATIFERLFGVKRQMIVSIEVSAWLTKVFRAKVRCNEMEKDTSLAVSVRIKTWTTHPRPDRWNRRWGGFL